jgi:hypothetical protein
MTQLKKTYRKLNPDMLYDEIRDLISRHGLSTADERMQTYSLGSGATQSRVTTSISTSAGKECGTLHILGSDGGDVRMTVSLDEALIAKDDLSSLREDVDFILGSYEVKW